MTDVCRCPKIQGNKCVLMNLWDNIEDRTSVPESVSIPLPVCNLSLEEQIADIELVYTSEIREHMLPPYSPLQVSGMEVDGKFRFPPVLRHYLTNISRQLQTEFPVLVQPFQYYRNRCEQGLLLEVRKKLFLAIRPRDYSDVKAVDLIGMDEFDSLIRFGRDEIDRQFTGCDEHPVWPHAIYAREFCGCGHVIWLRGGLAGYVQYCTPEPRPIVNTLYAFLKWLAIRMDPSPSGNIDRREVQCACLEDTTLIDRGNYFKFFSKASMLVKTSFSRFKVVLQCSPLPIRKIFDSYGIPERVPESLKNARCIGLWEGLSFRIVKGDEDASRCIQSLVPYVLTIQRQFRLWRWRKNVYWNPHTEVGRLGLEVQSRAFTAVHTCVKM